jgi:folate-binding protein YgfZ
MSCNDGRDARGALEKPVALHHHQHMTFLARLPERGVIEVTGEDRVAFLQGLVSNDVALATPGHAVWAALLTPQGKWLADFFILADGDRLLLETDAASLPMVLQKLTRFRLRSRVALRDVSPDLPVHVAWGDAPVEDAIIAPDPRLPEAGWRVLAPQPLPESATPEDWDRHRLSLGLPCTSDMESDKTVLLEAGFDELAGISWTKGCYMGQELTARTKYRGLLKRRLFRVRVDGDLPPPGSPVLLDGREVGTMRSGRGQTGLAHLRLDARSARLHCADAVLTPDPPEWMRLPEPAAQPVG